MAGDDIFAVSNREGTKVGSFKKNPDVYFLVDIADRGVRGRARAEVMDDSEHAVKILSHNLMRYLGSIDSPEAKGRLEIAKNHYSASRSLLKREYTNFSDERGLSNSAR